LSWISLGLCYGKKLSVPFLSITFFHRVEKAEKHHQHKKSSCFDPMVLSFLVWWAEERCPYHHPTEKGLI